MAKAKPRKREINKGRICKVEGCTYISKVKGFCNNCYKRIQHRRKKKG